ncbi:hypothetical protein KP509_18G084600 [Ceratopteris richardii]|uniref:Cohesin subunit SA-3 n=1 Tax=Ceratopteris richardii TaxID=49495 RepID=A0A8T2SW61_CERRI|nr:hypothetical protein KP509_18G084600 [Ceratopteris richardii]
MQEIIKHHGKLVRHGAKNWVENYEKDKNQALIELLNSLFEVCGVDYNMDDVPLDETDVDDIVLKVVSRAEEGFLEDYLSSKQKDLRGFKENLGIFWNILILECQNGPLFDGLLLDKCMDYVIALSCTPPRVFRQVTTIVGLQMVTSLVTVAKTLGESRETAQRQLNAEKKKRKEGPRIDALNKVLSDTHEKKSLADEMMRKMFTGLFMHRYRDVDAEIRMSCIRALGSWIVAYPSLFLKDLYLKYIGWTLNDKNPSVRKTSITALQNLYEIEDNVPSLGLFTERFCGRMIELADDIDISVAVSAIVLLKHLLRHQLLGDEDLGSLYDLLIDESPLIRHAVGDLVYDHLIAQKFSSSHTKGPETGGSEVQLSRLLQILREFSSDPILSDYVIDAVWQGMDAIKDWRSMISMLLDDNPKLELTDQDATHLVRVLSASAKKAVGGKIVPSAEPRKVTLSKAQKETLENNRNEITAALMKALPKIFRKYLADKAKVPHIADLVMQMNLEQFSLKRQEQTFAQVMQLLKEAFFKHGEESVLKACVKALAFCAGESQAELQDSAQHTMKLMEDELVLKLRSAINQAGVVDDDYSLTVNLRRLHQLQLNKPLTNEGVFTDLSGLLENFNNLEDEVVQLTLLNIFLHVIWCLKSIDFDNPDESGMSSLISKRDILIKHLESFGESIIESYKQGNARSLLSCTICVISSDLWTFFSKAKLSGTKINPLGIFPSEESLQKFWKLCEFRLAAADDEDDEEEDVTDEHLDYLSQKDVVVSAAAKLVAHDIVPKDYLGPEIVSHFVMHGKAVAETIKHMLTIVKKNAKSADLSNLYLDALKKAYERHKTEVQKTDEDWSTSRSFLSCKELASKLSATFSGSARNLYKSSILYIVKEGIKYAFLDAPKQLPFLEAGVLQFALKLPPVELQEILKDLQRRVEGINTDEDPSSWRPYITFIDYLREKAFKAPHADGEKVGTAIRSSSRSRKAGDIQGKKLFDGDNTTDDEEHLSETEEHEKHGGEDDDTPLQNGRQRMRSGDADSSKVNAAARESQAADSGNFSGIPIYNQSVFGSATEEQLPV